MAFAGEDVFGALGPPEGLRLFVVLREIVVDRGLQLIDAEIAAAGGTPWRDGGACNRQ